MSFTINGKGQIRHEYVPMGCFVSVIDLRSRNILLTFRFSERTQNGQRPRAVPTS